MIHFDIKINCKSYEFHNIGTTQQFRMEKSLNFFTNDLHCALLYPPAIINTLYHCTGHNIPVHYSTHENHAHTTQVKKLKYSHIVYSQLQPPFIRHRWKEWVETLNLVYGDSTFSDLPSLQKMYILSKSLLLGKKSVEFLDWLFIFWFDDAEILTLCVKNNLKTFGYYNLIHQNVRYFRWLRWN